MTHSRNITFVFVMFAFTGISSCYSTGKDNAQAGKQCTCDNLPFSWVKQKPGIEQKPIKGGVIKIRVSEEPPSLLPLLDPIPSVNTIILHDVLETLVRFEEGNVLPELAVAWEVDEQFISYTFKLDPRARWHDGTQVEAQDVEATFMKILDPDGQSGFEKKLSYIISVELLDEHVVAFYLDKPRPGFLKDLSEVAILPASTLGRSPLLTHTATRRPIGSGPFRFKRWIPGQQIELERNPDWRGNPPYIDRLQYWIVPDSRVALDMFSRGDLDIAPGLPGYTDAKPGSNLVVYPQNRLDAWVYNTTGPMFSKVENRKAVSSMIDVSAIRCSLFKCKADLDSIPKVLFGLLPRGKAGWNQNPKIASLEASGWIDRNGDGVRERGGVDFTFSLTIPNGDRDIQRMATVVQDALFINGIKMNVSTVDYSTYIGELRSHDFDAAYISLQAEPEIDLWPLFHSRAADRGQNYGAFESKAVDDLIDALSTASSESSRTEIMTKLKTEIERSHPLTVIQRPIKAALIASYVGGFNIHGDRIDVAKLWLAKGKGSNQ